jgi:hypothetical protein
MLQKLCLVMVAICIMAGCSNVILQDSNALALQIASQRIGFYVGKNNPDIVPHAKLIVDGIMANENPDLTKDALHVAIIALAKQFPNDPLLEGDLMLIVSALQIDLPETQIDLAQVRPLIIAFVNGLEIGASRPK